ncbi:metallophosphoesterase family protein [Streptomyces sp. NBC_01563]|uniref:metallophosphoesterase family protein n=1 Tax=Streptomyces sp. NBC_01563 TaxID=2975880 RepID=UPI003868138E
MSGIYAVSDLHVAYAENHEFIDRMWPERDGDWLIVAGDISEQSSDVKWVLRALSQRYEKVIWVPGNHELWTPADDPVQLRGEARYRYLVEMCRDLGVVTPEDPYPVWHGSPDPVIVAPLFTLYDYSFRPPGVATKAEGLQLARESGAVCTDEFLLHPDPYPSREAWCDARLAETEQRLSAINPNCRTILINHHPLIREPTARLKHQHFAQWCGTERTRDWHMRFRAISVVYGHLHIPQSTEMDGVAFEEVSIGYPREWNRRGSNTGFLRRIRTEPK